MEYNLGVAKRPAIFVSSTCYDLKQIRRNIQEFIEGDLGYEAILSEYDSFPIDPDMNTLNNCLRIVEQRADILVLIVAGRYGSITNHGDKSITNLEYLRAKAKGIPVYAFIDKAILYALPYWEDNPNSDFSKYVDSTKLFEFVNKIRNSDSVWVHEFESSNDIITCLKRQLSYLFNDSLLFWKHMHKNQISPKIMSYSGEVFQLAVEKPRGWEYRLFASTLKENIGKFDDLRYDLKYGISFRNVMSLDNPSEIVSWVSSKFNEVMNKIDILNVIMNQAITDAVGNPGEPGDADHIIYVAEKLVEVYKSFHEWSLDFKGVVVPDEFKKLLIYASQATETVIEDIEKFIDELFYGVQQMLLDLNDDSNSNNIKTVCFSLVLREPNIDNFNMELARIQKRLM